MAEETDHQLDATAANAPTDGDAVKDRPAEEQEKFESDFALKMVDTLVAINEQQISSYELPNRFFTKDELACFGHFTKSVPISPIPVIYPETGFLLFQGVPVPKSVNFTVSSLEEIEHILLTNLSEDMKILQLSDLGSDMINAYQMATQIYNDRLEKIRTSYFANVKSAKSQVMEISAAVVCGFVIILTLVSLT